MDRRYIPIKRNLQKVSIDVTKEEMACLVDFVERHRDSDWLSIPSRAHQRTLLNLASRSRNHLPESWSKASGFLSHAEEVLGRRIDLHGFMEELVDEWYGLLKTEEGKDLPSPAKVTECLWNEGGAWGGFDLNDSSNSMTIADVVKTAVIEYFGGIYWAEMEDYIDTLSLDELKEIDL